MKTKTSSRLLLVTAAVLLLLASLDYIDKRSLSELVISLSIAIYVLYGGLKLRRKAKQEEIEGRPPDARPKDWMKKRAYTTRLLAAVWILLFIPLNYIRFTRQGHPTALVLRTLVITTVFMAAMVWFFWYWRQRSKIG